MIDWNGTLGEAATAWGAAGFRVFPCGPDKRPLIKDWPNVATVDPGQISWWWRKHPDALIGAVTGELFSVLDIDVKGGRDGYKELAHLPMPGLIVQTVSGGGHMYFKADGERSTTNIDPFGKKAERGGDWLSGLDVRGEGGYVIVPPSPSYEIMYVDPEKALQESMAGWLGAEVPKVRRPTPADVAQFATTATPRGVSTDPDDNARPVSVDEARAALAHVPSDDRDLCVRVGSALKLELGEPGWDVFVEWCSRSEKFDKPDSAGRVGVEMCRAQWDNCTLTQVKRGTIFWLAEQHGWAPQRPAPVKKAVEPAVMQFVRLADVEAQDVHWLWLNRFARGKLSLLAGHPGLGKSQITIDIAARVTRGSPWPNGEGLALLGNVIFLSAEDDPADTIRPRMDAAGADVERAFVIAAIREKGTQRGFDLTRDLDRLDQLVQEIGDVRLIVIDPISAYLGGKMDSHRNTDVRAAL
ncbi:MAG: AAA family ATPase, partial [Planctomycetota bacterium]